MTDAVMRQLNEEEIGVLVKTLNGLSEFFYQYEQKREAELIASLFVLEKCNIMVRYNRFS